MPATGALLAHLESGVGGPWKVPMWPLLPERKGQDTASEEAADSNGFNTS